MRSRGIILALCLASVVMLFVLHFNGEQDNVQESIGRAGVAQAAAHDALHTLAPEEETIQAAPPASTIAEMAAKAQQRADAFKKHPLQGVMNEILGPPGTEEDAVEDDDDDEDDATQEPPRANLDVLNVDESMESEVWKDMAEESARREHKKHAVAEGTKDARNFRPSELVSHIPGAATAADPTDSAWKQRRVSRVSPPAPGSHQPSFQEALLALAPGGVPPQRPTTSKRPSQQVREVEPWRDVSHAFKGARNHPTQRGAVSDTGHPSQAGNAVFHPSGLVTSMLSQTSTKASTRAAPKKKKSTATAQKMNEFFHKKLATYKRSHAAKAKKAAAVKAAAAFKAPNVLHEMARHTREIVPVAAARAQKAAQSAALNAAATAILDKKKQQAALKAATAAAVKAAVASETASVHRVGHAFSEALKTKQSTRVRGLISRMKRMELRVKAKGARRSVQERTLKDRAYRNAAKAKAEKRVKVAHGRNVRMQRIAKRKAEVATKRDAVVAANRKRAYIAAMKRRGSAEGSAQFRKLKVHVSQRVKSFTHRRTKMQKEAAEKKKWANVKHKAMASVANVAQINAVIRRTEKSVPTKAQDHEDHDDHDDHEDHKDHDDDDEQLAQLAGLQGSNQALQEKLRRLQSQAQSRRAQLARSKELVAKRLKRHAKRAELQRRLSRESAKHARLQAKIAAVSKTLLSANTQLKRQVADIHGRSDTLNEMGFEQLVTADPLAARIQRTKAALHHARSKLASKVPLTPKLARGRVQRLNAKLKARKRTVSASQRAVERYKRRIAKLEKSLHLKKP